MGLGGGLRVEGQGWVSGVCQGYVCSRDTTMEPFPLGLLYDGDIIDHLLGGQDSDKEAKDA